MIKVGDNEVTGVRVWIEEKGCMVDEIRYFHKKRLFLVKLSKCGLEFHGLQTLT